MKQSLEGFVIGWLKVVSLCLVLYASGAGIWYGGSEADRVEQYRTALQAYSQAKGKARFWQKLQSGVTTVEDSSDRLIRDLRIVGGLETAPVEERFEAAERLGTSDYRDLSRELSEIAFIRIGSDAEPPRHVINPALGKSLELIQAGKPLPAAKLPMKPSRADFGLIGYRQAIVGGWLRDFAQLLSDQVFVLALLGATGLWALMVNQGPPRHSALLRWLRRWWMVRRHAQGELIRAIDRQMLVLRAWEGTDRESEALAAIVKLEAEKERLLKTPDWSAGQDIEATIEGADRLVDVSRHMAEGSQVLRLPRIPEQPTIGQK